MAVVSLNDLVLHMEVVGGIDSALFWYQVPDMTIGGEYLVVFA